MKKAYTIFAILIIIINCLCKIDKNNIEDDAINKEEMHEINQKIEGDDNYLYAEFAFEASDKKHYFKYTNSTLPSSNVTAFKIDFAQYSSQMAGYKVYCTNVESSKSDSELKTILNELTFETSTCVEISRSYGYFDGLAKLDVQKFKLGIILISEADAAFNGKINLRITERILGIDESKPEEEETYSLAPYTVNISKFRDKPASKILFYSSSRFLNMYYFEPKSPCPVKLFSGNILSVYTNPNMVKQKYHDAKTMILIASPFGFQSSPKLRETFKFEVKTFDSKYLLDYYVSSNPEGRPMNSPLLINMTECTNPYYVILNYNQAESSRTLVIDQIYGKLSYLSVATKFKQTTWDEMLDKDMNMIDINSRKYILPENSGTHLDVYKMECLLPLMLNFYYIEETILHEKMNYGDISIFTLQPFENANIPFFASVSSPNIVIEIFNSKDDPNVIVEAQREAQYKTNTLIKITLMSTNDGINIKERGGSNNTRIIIKVGYSNNDWKEIDQYMKYNEELKMYLFEFPNNEERYNFTLANLETSGTNQEDNVKYCFTPNIGGALKPSSENCYRVSSNNPYTLKVYNPLIMYKDYEYDDELSYYITFKAVTDDSTIEVKASVERYNTKVRNYEGINNKIKIENKNYSSILTPPKNKEDAIFLQVQVCDNENSIKAKIIKPLTGDDIVPERTIDKGKINQYITFKNDYIDTEFSVTGEEGVEVFLRMVGLPTLYTPDFNENYKINFDSKTNTLSIDSPLKTTEYMNYTVLIDKDISGKGLTLCSFVGKSYETLAKYWKTVVTNNKIASMQLNFNKAEMKPGDKFEAIVYIEQQTKSQMVFLSKVFTGTVGEIDIDTIHQINETYTDTNYVYSTVIADKNEVAYYFSYLPSEVLEVPVGALGIELDQSASGSFTGVFCTFVDDDSDAMSMIEAVETAIEDDTSYCIGSQSSVNSKRYNYIFKYEYENENTPKRMVIKITNNDVEGNFNIYVKKDQGVKIEKTDYETLKEYGQDEDSKKSVIPYIVDVRTLRGEDDKDYVSKVLFYSQHLEMQMYYIPEDSNKPIKLFCGNIALVYTNPQLAQQKYHATTLVLISENLEGQEHPSIGDSFRFHTKMFQSNAQIEFFVSQNPEGRTLNFPLSLEMNTCTEDNNKLYYILNYNKPESVRTLHLDMIFGYYLRARIAREINAQNWNQLIEQSMSTIENYQAELPEKSQHIDVIEIECSSPLLINAYYNYDKFPYNNVKKGEIVIKELPENGKFSFNIEADGLPLFYTISLFNPIESPEVTISFSNGVVHYISENSLQSGKCMTTPDGATILNRSKTKTRFILKLGFSVETSDEWHKEEGLEIKGTLFQNSNKYVYKFPEEDNNKRDFTTVSFLVNALNDDDENVKFCYSTNLGVAIEASRENCFRTGKFIPYTLTFINPLIVGKNYKVDNSANYYYISFRPFDDKDFISLKITETPYNNYIRNELDKPNVLTLVNGNAGTILSLPEQERNVFVQLKSCKTHNNPIQYYINNAFTQERIYEGKIYETDKHGIYHTIKNTYLENEVQLSGESEVTIFSKHTGIGNYELILEDYKTSFDSDSNTATIIKPVNNEEFNFTIIVDLRGRLNKYSLCDLSLADDKSKFGQYSYTFNSKSSNVITHYIDFNNFGFEEKTEFEILVYAKQLYNTKMEFLYPIIDGVVGKVSPVLSITEYTGQYKYVTAEFLFKSTSNYLYYDFTRRPDGDIASLRIKIPDNSDIKVSKIGCVFTSKNVGDSTMISDVNKAMLENRNVCLGEMKKSGYNALIKSKYGDNSRLVIQVLYGLGQEIKDEEKNLTINIKISGENLQNPDKYGESEEIAPIPYVIDLLKIREKPVDQMDYVSKVLFYSNSREMEMFYIGDQSSSPVSLFTGNIMLVYTNEELINQKYHGATTMILLSDSLSSSDKVIFGEKFRFMVRFFDSASQIQYYVSNNPNGRYLNNPTSIEMTSCNSPYYYILNYNQIENAKRTLHIDTIFGEKVSIKLASKLNHDSWEELVSKMVPFEGEQIVIEPQEKYHFDVIEVKCQLPLLLNLYYVDPDNPKESNLEIGDITILSLVNGEKKNLYFKTGEAGPFVYSFNVYKENNLNPNIEITFEDESPLVATENGVYTKESINNYQYLTIHNRDNTGSVNTRIIFKFGYVIESTFKRLESGIYTNEFDVNRTITLYGFKYDTTSKRLNYTGVDFKVTTEEDNVKFCYSTNLGTYINPSLQNCYRVGKNNPYTIPTLNPLVMYKNYYDDDVINYYVGFRTVEVQQSITIEPILKPYDTTERNLEGAKNKINIPSTGQYSTILTAPKNNEPFIFTHIHVCTKNNRLSYRFVNGYDGTDLNARGEIIANSKNNFVSVSNTKLDTELKLESNKDVEVFVKHVGISERYIPYVKDIKIDYNTKTQELNWTQPIENEEFKYTIYLDKLDNFKNKVFTLCNVTEISKLGHYSETIRSSDNNPKYVIPFGKPELGDDYKDFGVIILAEQVNKGAITIISLVTDSNGKSYDGGDDDSPDEDNTEPNSNVGLIVLIVILSVIILIGAGFALHIYCKYRSKGQVSGKNKETSMALIKNTKTDKLVESQAQETNQIDP